MRSAAPNKYSNRSLEKHSVLLGFFIIVTFTRCFLVVIYNTRAGLRQITSSVNEARSIVFYSGFRCFSAVGNPTVGLACPDLARCFLLKITTFSFEMLQVFGNIRRHHLRVLYCIFQVFAMFWTTLEDPCQRHFLDSAADVLQNNYNPQVREHPCKP